MGAVHANVRLFPCVSHPGSQPLTVHSTNRLRRCNDPSSSFWVTRDTARPANLPSGPPGRSYSLTYEKSVPPSFESKLYSTRACEATGPRPSQTTCSQGSFSTTCQCTLKRLPASLRHWVSFAPFWIGE